MIEVLSVAYQQKKGHTVIVRKTRKRKQKVWTKRNIAMDARTYFRERWYDLYQQLLRHKLVETQRVLQYYQGII